MDGHWSFSLRGVLEQFDRAAVTAIRDASFARMATLRTADGYPVHLKPGSSLVPGQLEPLIGLAEKFMLVTTSADVVTLPGGLHDRVSGGGGVGGGVSRRGRVATTDVSALKAYPKIDNRPVIRLVVLIGSWRADVAGRGGEEVLASCVQIGRPSGAPPLPKQSQWPITSFVLLSTVGTTTSTMASLLRRWVSRLPRAQAYGPGRRVRASAVSTISSSDEAGAAVSQAPIGVIIESGVEARWRSRHGLSGRSPDTSAPSGAPNTASRAQEDGPR